MRVGGLPGVHSFHSGWDWLWLKPVKVNEPITCSFRPSIFWKRKANSHCALSSFTPKVFTAISAMKLSRAVSVGVSVPNAAPPLLSGQIQGN